MGMNAQHPIGERDRDRALTRLRWLTATSGIASLAVAAFATSAAAQASTPPVQAPASGSAQPHPAAGSLTAEQLAALDFRLPKPGTVVIWATPGQAPAPGRAAPPGPAAAAPPAPPAPRPAPTPPPPPVATTGTS
jgi:hypothetical protein